MRLNTVKYQACGDKLCLSVVEARREARNKAEVGRWMDRVSNIVRYYRGEVGDPTFHDKKNKK